MSEELTSEDVKEWVRAQGLDPKNVKVIELDHRINSTTPIMKVTEYVRDENGLIVLNRITDEPVIASRWIPIQACR